MRFLLLPLVLATIFISPHTAAASSAPPRKALLGGWEPIEDINDPHVREIGEYAVSEHNKMEKADLAFSKVVRGETQVVSGTNYRLVVEAKNSAAADYEAVVWEQDWKGFRQLSSFKLVKG